MAYVNRGNAYDERGQIDKAIEDYSQAISMHPNYADAYYNRGITYHKIGKFYDATSDFKKACEMGSKNGCDSFKTLSLKP